MRNIFEELCSVEIVESLYGTGPGNFVIVLKDIEDLDGNPLAKKSVWRIATIKGRGATLNPVTNRSTRDFDKNVTRRVELVKGKFGNFGLPVSSIKAEASADGDSCPASTQNLKLNTKNRDQAIKADYIQYGPLNVDEPGDYWEKIAKKWETTVDAAKKSLCENCVAFDVSPRMKDCMPGETSDDDGVLGYCWMHHFKCHSARTCHTWAKGGPIDTSKVSVEWQSRAQKNESDDDQRRSMVVTSLRRIMQTAETVAASVASGAMLPPWAESKVYNAKEGMEAVETSLLSPRREE